MADHPVHKIIELTADEGITLQKSSDGKNLKVSANITQVQSDWNQTTSSAADFIKNKPTIPAAQVNADWNASSGAAQILNKPTIPAAQVNSDWNASSGVAQILNKPSIPDPQIQSDWEQSDDSAVDFIKNKPTIPPAQVNADWNATSGIEQILNKPTIPAAQIQSDWNQTNSTSADYIKNKPTIITPVQSDWEESDNTSLAYIQNKPSILPLDILSLNGINYNQYIRKFEIGGYNYYTTSGFNVSYSSGSEFNLPTDTGFIYSFNGALKISYTSTLPEIKTVYLGLYKETFDGEDWTQVDYDNITLYNRYAIDLTNESNNCFPFGITLSGTNNTRYKFRIYTIDENPSTGDWEHNDWTGNGEITYLSIYRFTGTEHQL